VPPGITSDLKAARNIASQVAGGVAAAASGVQQGVESIARVPLAAVAAAPRQLGVITEAVREQFFTRNVPFGSIIYQEARKNDLPPELVAAVVQQESKFSPTARSGAGAIGLMQLIPKTGRWLGARDLTNPAQNIQAGAKYLRYLHDRFGGDAEKAIAAYNAGEGNVRRFNGIPPFRETRDYVARVKSFQQDYASRADRHTVDLAAAAAPMTP
jgi:soluble lytic murein transglycosylase-like protein